MELIDIKKCPVCNSKKLNRKTKTFIKCENCNTKIGIKNNKLWYEYVVKEE